MQSDGGLTPMEKFDGARAIVSGPAGGVVGYATTAYTPGSQAVIGFDMGGTSTDVGFLCSLPVHSGVRSPDLLARMSTFLRARQQGSPFKHRSSI